MITGAVLLILLKIFFKEKRQRDHREEAPGISHDELFKEDLEYDPSWSVLSSNTHHSNDD
jgi:hypothetical protein